MPTMDYKEYRIISRGPSADLTAEGFAVRVGFISLGSVHLDCPVLFLYPSRKSDSRPIIIPWNAILFAVPVD